MLDLAITRIPAQLLGEDGVPFYETPNDLPGLLFYYLDGSPYYASSRSSGRAVLRSLLPDQSLPGIIETPAPTFDGTNDYVTYAGRVTSETATALTVSAWIYPTSVTGFRCIAGEWSGPSKYGWTLYLNAGKLVFAVSDGSGTGLTRTADVALTVNTPYHVVGVFGSSAMTLYVNGSAVSATSSGSTTTLNPGLAKFDLGVFNRDSSATGYFAGRISDINIWTAAKNSTEVAAIYLGNDDTTSLVVSYPMQEGSGNTHYDISGAGKHITAINFTSQWSSRFEGYPRDRFVQSGGLVSGAVAIPGLISGLNAANGSANTFEAGKHGNPGSRLVPNWSNNAGLTAIGLTTSTKLAPTDDINGIAPADTKFRKTQTQGDSRFFGVSIALTGTDLESAEIYSGMTILPSIVGSTRVGYGVVGQ